MISQIDNNSGLELLNTFFKRLKHLNVVCTKLGKFFVIPFFVISFLYVFIIGVVLSFITFIYNILLYNRFKNIKLNLNKLYNDLFFR